MTRSDQIPLIAAVWFVVFGIGLVVGIAYGWAFALGVGVGLGSVWVGRWADRQ